ncbi:hypothetical protein [Streptomyces beijiangensis]|uniref:Uncharacterized protein n=1 Tax=Streptomyces beijiangensis TaxID=163361 RepID=A0A939FDV1_9ACTN|nr:hypothetical protein [Streptomyces beijiangensis]MBO0515220.1 hypothetical protein [Streptomyces beijiangensis]
MTHQPSVAQRRVLRTADPESGLLHGPAAALAALVAQGLAMRHPRPPHRHFLTPAGQRMREELADEAVPLMSADTSGVFAARTGGESAQPDDPARLREVRSAWAGLLEMRRVTNADRSADRPCAWERSHLTQSAALALEAAGCRGYLVAETAQPEAVRVAGPDAPDYAEALERAGWQTSAHLDRRAGATYLLASPRRS